MVSIDAFVKSMEVGSENFTLANEGNIHKFQGIEIAHLDHRQFKLSQPFLINIIILFLRIHSNNYGIGTKSKSTPVGKPFLQKYLYVKPQK